MNNNEKIEKVRFVVHSLTRAKFVETMNKQQIDVVSRNLNAIDYDRRIKDKLLEAIQSIVFPRKSNDFLESLADSLEIIFLLAGKQEISASQIEQRRQEKLLEQGDFDTSVYNYLLKMDANNPLVRYLREDSSNYTEVDENLKAVKIHAGLLALINEEETPESIHRQSRWEIYYEFEKVVYEGTDAEIKKILDQFTYEDFLNIPIIIDLISYKKMRLMKLLHQRNMPFTYSNWRDANALHVACSHGYLEGVKFLIENNLITDIHENGGRFDETPYILALAYDRHEVVEYLEKKFYINYLRLSDVRSLMAIKDMIYARR